MEEETEEDIVNLEEEGDEESEEKLEDEPEVEKEEEPEEEEEEEVKPLKKRRCQRRKKVRQICFDDENECEEEEEEEEEGRVDEEGEEDEEEESDIISYESSVLSAITFEWENEIYEFEELCDPGNIDTIYQRETQVIEELDEIGIVRYLQLCRALSVTPMIRVIRSLKNAELDLSHRNMDSKSIRAVCAALEMNNIVRRFILKFNKLVRDDCYYIGLMLKTNERLSVLDFTGCRIGPEGLGLLMEYMAHNEVLLDLNLSKCGIRDEGMKILAYVISRNNSIEKLDLSYNKLGDEAGEALAAAFKLNSSITDLNLSYNNLYNPNAVRAFFRTLAVFNSSISRLNLSWNGLSGPDIGGQIGNFLRKSSSIQHLDLTDNRFEGLAVVEIRKGLSRCVSIETLKMGKNPMTCYDLEDLIVGVKTCTTLRLLDLEDLWVRKDFFKLLNKILKSRELEVNIGGVYSDYEVFGPDYPKIILQRAQFEAMKPKSEKKRKDFGHLIWTLGDEPLSEEDFMAHVKKFKAKINKELFPELMKEFKNPKTQLIDVVAMRKKYLSIFPDSTPPPLPKPKKGEGVPEETPAAAPLEEAVRGAPAVPSEREEAPGVPSEGEEGEESDWEGLTELEDEKGELIIDGTEEFQEENMEENKEFEEA